MGDDENAMKDGLAKVAAGWVLPGSTLVLLAGLMMSVSNEAAIGLRLGEQHGNSILLLREEVRLLREEIKTSTRDRYTSKDAERDLTYIRRDIAEIKDTLKGLN